MDRGPWVVQLWPGSDLGGKHERVVLQSEDFRHDVALIITGDFEDLDQKKQYALDLATALNSVSPNNHPVMVVMPRRARAEVITKMRAKFLEDFRIMYKNIELTASELKTVDELMVKLYETSTEFADEVQKSSIELK